MTEERKKRRWARRLGILTVILIMALLSLSFIVHIPAVQTWGIRQISAYITNKTDSRVTVRKFDFNIFRHFELRDFHLAPPGAPFDTLLYAKNLNVRFSKLWSLTRQELYIKSVNLTDAQLNIARKHDDDISNLTYVITRLFDPDSVRTREDPRLLVLADRLSSENLTVTYTDDHNAMTHLISVPLIDVEFDAVDFRERSLVVNSINVIDPTVRLSKADSVYRTVERPLEPDSAQWLINICEFNLQGGTFGYEQAWRSHQFPGIDYSDLRLTDLQMNIKDFWMQGLDLRTTIDHLAFIEQSGFQLSDLKAGELRINRKEIALDEYKLETPFSTIGDRLAVSFNDIGDIDNFADDVVLDARFADARIWIKDLLQAIPGLQTSEFFTRNIARYFSLDGYMSGTLNRLRGSRMSAGLGELSFNGSFRSRNLTVPEEQFVNLEIDDASFDRDMLAETLPGVDLPLQFNKLGTMHFTGRFDGFLQDFVAFGELTSDLGTARMDMRLNLKPGRTMAEYSGSLELLDFDLRTWTGNPDFGMIAVEATISEGRGLTPESANAQFAGDIRILEYKDYRYEQVGLAGYLDKNYFNGSMRVRDDNIDVNFLGSVDFRDTIPAFDFEADIALIDFRALNLSKDTNVIKGTFDVEGAYRDLNNVFGTATVRQMELYRSASEIYELDTLELDVREFPDNTRKVTLHSDFMSGVVEGIFDLRTVYPQLRAMLSEQFPKTISGTSVLPDSNAVVADFKFDLLLADSRGLNLLGVDKFRFDNAILSGVVDVRNDQLIAAYYFPDFHVSDFNFYDIEGELHVQNGRAQNISSITAVDHKEKYFFDDILIRMEATDDALDWHLQTEDLLAAVNKLDVRGQLAREDDKMYSAHIQPVELILFDDPWQLDQGNKIIWGSDSIFVEDFVLSHNDERIALRSVDGRGLILDVDGFDMHYIDQLWVYDKLDFSGRYSMTAMAEDIFDKTGIYVWIEAPDFRVNDTTFGLFSFDVRMEGVGQPAMITLRMDKPSAHLHADGFYYPPFNEVPEELRNSIDLGVRLDTFPIDFLEFLLDGGINNTRGSLIGDVRIFGPMDNIDMKGELVTKNGATTVTYLGTRYWFDNQHIGITKSMFDFTDAELTDAAGQTAVIIGGITHTNTKNLGLAARITSPQFVSLSTTRSDNSLYYGTGIGEIDARFDGPMQRPEISVNASAGEGTHIYIAVDEDADEEGQETFLRFVEHDSVSTLPQSAEQTQIRGINFDMNLTMTQDADVDIIFNERSEDIIKVTGDGSLQLEVTRTGEFTIYGTYEIEQGNYLFTNFVLNKPFEIRRGGVLRWTGDPYDAQIDLQAEYSGIRTSLNTFLEEYLINASPAAKSEASIKTPVSLTMFLTGSLLEPEINFDIRFPEVTGELAGYVDSKLRILQANENAMNEQVFGLLWAGTFLPSNVLQSDNTTELAGSGIYNTLSEFLSNQLSLFLSEVLERAVADVDFISGIDFDVAYNKDYDFDLQNYSATEWELRLKNRLFDDRIILDVGGNYVTDSPVAGTYFAGDYALEYVLTSDRRLKVRFYHRSERTIEGQKNKVGIGLSYRREFDSFGEWLRGLDNEAKKLKSSAGQQSEGPAQ